MLCLNNAKTALPSKETVYATIRASFPSLNLNRKFLPYEIVAEHLKFTLINRCKIYACHYGLSEFTFVRRSA